MYLRFATGVHASAPLCIVPVRGPMFTRLLHDKKKRLWIKTCNGLFMWLVTLLMSSLISLGGILCPVAVVA